MPSLQSVRRKIDSVKKTQKITKAMKMVAAAKLKRTQTRILAARPYALKMRETIRNLSRRVKTLIRCSVNGKATTVTLS